MADLENFDANAVEPNQAFDLIPDGWYEAIMSDSERKANSAGTGELLKLTFTLTQAPYANRLQWDNLNIKHPNQQTVQIARGTLSAICRAVGILTPKDSTQLHSIPLLIKIGHEIRKDTGETVNKIKGYKARDGQQTASVPQKQPVPAGPAAAPWKK